MKYSFYKKRIGVNDCINIINIKTSQEIFDICFINNLGILYSCGNILGLIDSENNNIECWKGDKDCFEIKDGSKPFFKKISGITYFQKNNCVFLSDNDGRTIRLIDIENNYTNTILNGNSKHYWEEYIKNIENINMRIVCNDYGKIFMVSDKIRKCFMIKDNEIIHFAGNGNSNICFGNDILNTSIGYSNGIAVRSNNIFISDKSRGIIVELNKKGSRFLCGNLNEPSKLLCKNNALYIMCKNGIYSYSFLNNKLNQNPIYKSDSLESITCDNNFLYILERKDA
jgi:hypothetical protein